MKRLSERKLILVTRTTRLVELVRRFNTVAQARFYIEHLGGDFSDYEQEDATYQAAITKAEGVLGMMGRVQTLEHRFVPNFMFGPEDIVVAIGQDGLVANTVKYLKGQPLLGVNPDPQRWEGQLLPFRLDDLAEAIPMVLADRAKTVSVTLAEAQLNDGQFLLAVNDLFIGPKSHTSATYALAVGGRKETQSSSGVIVSTGVGSTGWFTSLMTGAAAIYGARTGKSRALNRLGETRFAWDADRLVFTVREPFPTRTTGTTLVHGEIKPGEPLVITSCMAEHGVIFSDGMEKDFLNFNSGAEVRIGIAAQKGCLVT